MLQTIILHLPKLKMKLIRFFLIFFLFTSCNERLQVTQEGRYDTETRKFTSELINWEVIVPENWVITSIDTIKSQLKRGVDILEFDESEPDLKKEANVQNLIAFKKNNQNTFTAFLEEVEFDESNFQSENIRNKEFLINQIEMQGIKVDTNCFAIRCNV